MNTILTKNYSFHMQQNLANIEFVNWVNQLKQKVNDTRTKMAFSINAHLIGLYWEIGKEIELKLNQSKWGVNLIENLSNELQIEFPEMKGFSRRNLYAIRQWYKFYSTHFEFVPQPVAQIPWGHNLLIINKIKEIETALFYAKYCVQNNWERKKLENEIKNQLHLSIDLAINNFDKTLSHHQSNIIHSILKDPYNFDFLGLNENDLEKKVEEELTKQMTQFLLELGKGFAFVGRQYKLKINQNEYFLDLLFYHLELRSYIVIELKSGKFKPEYIGKMSFYLSAVDDQLKNQADKPTIGILLCKSKNKIEVEYTLRDFNKPISVSEYKLTHKIPEKIKYKLPSVEEFQNGLL